MEITLLVARRTMIDLEVLVVEEEISATKSLKYLGVSLGKDVNMIENMRNLASRWIKNYKSRERVFGNEEGPRMRTLNNSGNGMMLYAVPV